MTNNLTEILYTIPIKRGLTTKFYGPTNHKGARIKVSTEGQAGKKTVNKFFPVDHAQSVDGKHLKAALDYIEAYEEGRLTIISGATTPDGTGYVWCLQLK
jgi:hypothetical protein